MIKELFNKSDRKLGDLADEMRTTKQRLSALEQVARQPRLAMEVDVSSDTKTRERTEGAATAVQVKHGDDSIGFGDDSTGLPVLPCSRGDTLVDNGAAAPKSFLSPLEMRMLTATGGLLPASTASTATRTTLTNHIFGSVRPKTLI